MISVQVGSATVRRPTKIVPRSTTISELFRDAEIDTIGHTIYLDSAPVAPGLMDSPIGNHVAPDAANAVLTAVQKINLA